MKCPHCLENFFEDKESQFLDNDEDGNWYIEYTKCPSCKRIIVYLCSRAGNEYLVRPRGISRSPLPVEVPSNFAIDYKEACLVLSDSPKASAALSRRCLQNLLEGEFEVKKEDLYKEIQEVLDLNKLPSYISNNLDAVRNIGNFATHPKKSKNSGEIVDVEPGEAEWNLDILESLFDFCFVQKEKIRIKKETLNQKLKDIGKPPMK